jgi:hypothetical protein
MKLQEATRLVVSGGEGPDRGLYLFLHANDTGRTIWDANPKPKVIASPGEWVVKVGKYEGRGLRYRLASYMKWHHGEEGPNVNPFTSTLRLALLLPLDDASLPYDLNPAALTEPYWNGRWFHWLDREGLVAGGGRRGEYRRVIPLGEGETKKLRGEGEAITKGLSTLLAGVA